MRDLIIPLCSLDLEFCTAKASSASLLTNLPPIAERLGRLLFPLSTRFANGPLTTSEGALSRSLDIHDTKKNNLATSSAKASLLADPYAVNGSRTAPLRAQDQLDSEKLMREYHHNQ